MSTAPIVQKLKAIASDLKQIRTEEGPLLSNTVKWAGRRIVWQVDRFENRIYPIKVARYFSKLKKKKTRYNGRHMQSILLGGLSGTRLVPHLLFHVCAKCQNRCANCAHSGLIELDPTYEMSISTVMRFLECTKASRYFIENLWIDGPGEPTLWRHFNEGIDLLYASECIGTINITTNGRAIQNINETTWSKLNKVVVSIYPNSDPDLAGTLQHLSRKHRFVLDVRDMTYFLEPPKGGRPDALPAFCICSGPMIYSDYVFYYCGPPAIDAAKQKGENLFENQNHCGPIKLDYLDKISTRDLFGPTPYREAAFDHCRYCILNWRRHPKRVPHAWLP